nr:beach domain-containing protein c2 [Ipomoea trifida]
MHKNGWSLSNNWYSAAMPPIPVPDAPPTPRPPPSPDSSNNRASSIATDFFIKGSSIQSPLESFSNADFQVSLELPPPPNVVAFEDSEGSPLAAAVERLPIGKTAERGDTKPAEQREEQ